MLKLFKQSLILMTVTTSITVFAQSFPAGRVAATGSDPNDTPQVGAVTTAPGAEGTKVPFCESCESNPGILLSSQKEIAKPGTYKNSSSGGSSKSVDTNQ